MSDEQQQQRQQQESDEVRLLEPPAMLNSNNLIEENAAAMIGDGSVGSSVDEDGGADSGDSTPPEQNTLTVVAAAPPGALPPLASVNIDNKNDTNPSNAASSSAAAALAAAVGLSFSTSTTTTTAATNPMSSLSSAASMIGGLELATQSLLAQHQQQQQQNQINLAAAAAAAAAVTSSAAPVLFSTLSTTSSSSAAAPFNPSTISAADRLMATIAAPPTANVGGPAAAAAAAISLPGMNGDETDDGSMSKLMETDSGVPLEEKMMALHELFRKKQQDLLVYYQQAQQDLAQQHVRYSLQLSQAFEEEKRRHEQEMAMKEALEKAQEAQRAQRAQQEALAVMLNAATAAKENSIPTTSSSSAAVARSSTSGGNGPGPSGATNKKPPSSVFKTPGNPSTLSSSMSLINLPTGGRGVEGSGLGVDGHRAIGHHSGGVGHHGGGGPIHQHHGMGHSQHSGTANELRRTMSTSGAISSATREKLIEVLAKKQEQKKRNRGSPQYPYPTTQSISQRNFHHHSSAGPGIISSSSSSSAAAVGGGGVGGHSGVVGGHLNGSSAAEAALLLQNSAAAEFELRKVNSEPNLKMKQRLRDKLRNRAGGIRSPPNLGRSSSSAFKSPTASTSSTATTGIATRLLNMNNSQSSNTGVPPSSSSNVLQHQHQQPHLIFPSPSLPNIPSFPTPVRSFDVVNKAISVVYRRQKERMDVQAAAAALQNRVGALGGGGGGVLNQNSGGTGVGGLNPGASTIAAAQQLNPSLFLSMPSLFPYLGTNPQAPPMGITLPLAITSATTPDVLMTTSAGGGTVPSSELLSAPNRQSTSAATAANLLLAAAVSNANNPAAGGAEAAQRSAFAAAMAAAGLGDIQGGGATNPQLVSALLANRYRAGARVSGEGDMALGATHRTVPSPMPLGGHPSLLKQQLRDLVLRRKSLVPEETDDEVKRSGSGEVSVIQGLDGGESSSSSTGKTGEETGVVEVGKSGVGSVEFRTGLAYDAQMCKHQCMCGQNAAHVEHGGRIHSIWARLIERGLVDQCDKVNGKKISLEDLKRVHSDTYVTFFAVSPTACLKMVESCRDPNQLPLTSFVRLRCGGYGVDSDTYFNDASTQTAARIAAGNVTELTMKVLEGRLLNGFAVVRPPGHHAERDQAMGFCYFNNVSIAARVAQHRWMVAGKEPPRIAIIDWDVHHGNGTQLAFDRDPSVLYLSLHRHDNGNFFPGTGAVTEIGTDAGRHLSVNISWSGGEMGDTEYLAAWRVIVNPVLDQFKPEIIIVSCGFDGAKGHSSALGGYELTPGVFGFMTRELMRHADGKVVLALEGGYDLASISECAEICVKALVGPSMDNGAVGDSFEWISKECLQTPPLQKAQETLQKVVAVHKGYWRKLMPEAIGMSQTEWDSVHSRFASLSMKQTMNDQ